MTFHFNLCRDTKVARPCSRSSGGAEFSPCPNQSQSLSRAAASNRQREATPSSKKGGGCVVRLGSTSNVQHRAPNIQCSQSRQPVGCWTMDVGCSMFPPLRSLFPLYQRIHHCRVDQPARVTNLVGLVLGDVAEDAAHDLAGAFFRQAGRSTQQVFEGEAETCEEF
jgi:hypothetical protein